MPRPTRRALLRAALALVAVLALSAAAVYFWLTRGSGELARGADEARLALPPLPVTRIGVAPFVQADHAITHMAPMSEGRLLLVEKRGRVLLVEGEVIREAPVLDIARLVDAGPSERGLLSVAYGADPPRLYVDYTDLEGSTVVARYEVDAAAAVADPVTAEILLTIEQPAANHNGGQLALGPDGHLYVGTGDGGAAHDPWDNAESLDSLLGKLLRLDVTSGSADHVPVDNPHVGQPGARPEVWASGLRNPWRFSFDRATGDLYIADVGQNAWEEVNVQPASSRGGERYGWDTLEGLHCHEPAEGCDATGTVAPVAVYGHDEGCSITGGFVYRGPSLEGLRGTYVFGDFCTGRIWGLARGDDGAFRMSELLDTELNIASFAEDAAGELYVLDLAGAVYRVTGGEGAP